MGSRNENCSFVHILLDINLTFLRRKHKFKIFFIRTKNVLYYYCRIKPSEDMNEGAAQKWNIYTGSHERLLGSYLLNTLIYINVYKTFFVGMPSNNVQNIKMAFPLKWRIFLMQKCPFVPARDFSFICSKILYKDFLMKPRVRRFFSKMFEDFLQNT